ncbi:MAG: hypothetical protein PHE53_09645 [Thermoguttaceae bacterium]|nr:hypothetical protein [Thermoguttaceae bacterium]
MKEFPLLEQWSVALQHGYSEASVWLFRTVGLSLRTYGDELVLLVTLVVILLCQSWLGRTRLAGKAMFFFALLGFATFFLGHHLASRTPVEGDTSPGDPSLVAQQMSETASQNANQTLELAEKTLAEWNR